MRKYIFIILLFLISCKGEVPQKYIDNRIIVFNMFVANGKVTPFSIDVCENKENVLIKTNTNVVIVLIFLLKLM